MLDLMVPQTMFAVPVTLIAVMAVCVMALVVLRRIRMERPPVGVFNGRDIAVLYIFIIGLPLLYVVLPRWALTGFLIVTFAAALSIGYRSVLPRQLLWPVIGLLIGAEIWVAENMLGTVEGWQLFMVMNSTLVLLTAVAVANLYVQGGMRLQHVAWFAVTLGFYDLMFVSFTVRLADAFIGKPLNPSMGLRTGIFEANIGLGDLLVYALFTMAAFKAYGPRAARAAIGVIAVFGSIAPTVAPLIISEFTRGSTNIVTPAQIFFGPAAIITYLLLKRRYGRERTFAEYRADPSGSVRPSTRASADARPVSPAVPAAAGSPAAAVVPAPDATAARAE